MLYNSAIQKWTEFLWSPPLCECPWGRYWKNLQKCRNLQRFLECCFSPAVSVLARCPWWLGGGGAGRDHPILFGTEPRRGLAPLSCPSPSVWPNAFSFVSIWSLHMVEGNPFPSVSWLLPFTSLSPAALWQLRALLLHWCPPVKAFPQRLHQLKRVYLSPALSKGCDHPAASARPSGRTAMAPPAGPRGRAVLTGTRANPTKRCGGVEFSFSFRAQRAFWARRGVAMVGLGQGGGGRWEPPVLWAPAQTWCPPAVEAASPEHSHSRGRFPTCWWRSGVWAGRGPALGREGWRDWALWCVRAEGSTTSSLRCQGARLPPAMAPERLSLRVGRGGSRNRAGNPLRDLRGGFSWSWSPNAVFPQGCCCLREGTPWVGRGDGAVAPQYP